VARRPTDWATGPFFLAHPRPPTAPANGVHIHMSLRTADSAGPPLMIRARPYGLAPTAEAFMGRRLEPYGGRWWPSPAPQSHLLYPADPQSLGRRTWAYLAEAGSGSEPTRLVRCSIWPGFRSGRSVSNNRNSVRRTPTASPLSGPRRNCEGQASDGIGKGPLACRPPRKTSPLCRLRSAGPQGIAAELPAHFARPRRGTF